MTDPTPADEKALWLAAVRESAERVETFVRGLSVIKEILAIEATTQDFPTTCRRILEAIAHSLFAENCSLMLFDDMQQCLELRAAANAFEPHAVYYPPSDDTDTQILPPNHAGRRRFAFGEGVAGRAAQQKTLLHIKNTLDHPDFKACPDARVDVRSLIAVPLIFEGQVLGVLNLSHSSPNRFSKEDERIASIIADACRCLLGPLIVQASHRSDGRPTALAAEVALMLNPQGSVVCAGPGVEQLLGYGLTDLVANLERFFAGVPAAQRIELITHRQYVLQSGRPSCMTYDYIHASGRTLRLIEVCFPILQKDGSNLGAVAVLRDTQTLPAEEIAALEAQHQLLHAQRLQTLGELARGVAHDLNNVFAAVLGNLSLALETAPDTIRPFLDEAHRTGWRGAEMARQLLTFGQMDDAAMAPLDITVLLHEVGSFCRSSMDRIISVEVKTDPDVPMISANTTQMHQLLLNLCVNARDALLTAHEQEPGKILQLTLGADIYRCEQVGAGSPPLPHPGSYVRVYVSDTGTGMDERTRAQIFKPFFTTKPKGKGTGLGLATVYQIVKAHGAAIDVWSKLGEGTTFSVYFPVLMETSEQRPATSAPTAEAHTIRQAGECILFVDDDSTLCQLGRAMLERHGYRVLVAEDGEAAIDVFRAHQHEIRAVLLDLSLPKQSGWEVLRALRDINRRVPILVMSGRGQEASPYPEPSYHPDGFLSKPFQWGAVMSRLRTLLEPPEDMM